MRDFDDRGQSVSVFAILIMGAMILTAGLVIDGGQKVSAASRSEVAASGAARAAGNAAATQELAGSDPAGAAVSAARSYLAGQPDVQGTVSVSAGVVTIHTRTTEPTIFLSAIGLRSVQGIGSAQANLVATGQTR